MHFLRLLYCYQVGGRKLKWDSKLIIFLKYIFKTLFWFIFLFSNKWKKEGEKGGGGGWGGGLNLTHEQFGLFCLIHLLLDLMTSWWFASRHTRAETDSLSTVTFLFWKSKHFVNDLNWHFKFHKIKKISWWGKKLRFHSLLFSSCNYPRAVLKEFGEKQKNPQNLEQFFKKKLFIIIIIIKDMYERKTRKWW